jgi:hypothetical protein
VDSLAEDFSPYPHKRSMLNRSMPHWTRAQQKKNQKKLDMF